jgi:hypothetical protein
LRTKIPCAGARNSLPHYGRELLQDLGKATPINSRTAKFAPILEKIPAKFPANREHRIQPDRTGADRLICFK